MSETWIGYRDGKPVESFTSRAGAELALSVRRVQTISPAHNSAPSTKTVQQDTIEALEALTEYVPGRIIRVEAWALPYMATEHCSHDHHHGPGTCYGPTGDALCLACQIRWIEDNSAGGLTISIDVAR